MPAIWFRPINKLHLFLLCSDMCFSPRDQGNPFSACHFYFYIVRAETLFIQYFCWILRATFNRIVHLWAKICASPFSRSFIILSSAVSTFNYKISFFLVDILHIPQIWRILFLFSLTLLNFTCTLSFHKGTYAPPSSRFYHFIIVHSKYV